MTSLPRPLTRIAGKLKTYHAKVRVKRSTVRITVDLMNVNFAKISPLLYLTLNKFENLYLVLIEGIPFCLMPDAADHLVYSQTDGIRYRKDTICKKCKYHDQCPGWMKDAQINKRPPAVADIPREIAFEVTTKCNLNCRLCFSSKCPQELPLQRIKTLIDECRRLGIKNVRFTGGEPLLYPNIAEALRYAKNKNLHVTVNTNATMISGETERMLRDYVDDLLISLQGFHSASEKRLTRSPVDFKQKIGNIVRLNSRIAGVRLGTIISRTLVDNFSKYSYLIKSLGIRKWGLFRPMASMPSGEFHVTPADFRKLMKNIRAQNQRGLDIRIANALPFCLTADTGLSHQVLSGGEFDDGHSRLVMDARGFLKPSYSISKDLGPTIQKAWKRPFMKKIRALNYLPKKCQGCSSLRWCKGGSRHWARITHGDYFAADPLMDKN